MIKEYFNYSYQPEITIAEHLGNLQNYKDQLALVGETIFDGIKKHYQLCNISAEFKYIVQATSLHKKLTLTQLKEGLKVQEIFVQKQLNHDMTAFNTRLQYLSHTFFSSSTIKLVNQHQPWQKNRWADDEKLTEFGYLM